MISRSSLVRTRGARWGAARLRRPRVVAAGLGFVLALSAVSGCTVNAGSAIVVNGTTISEEAVQHDTAAFIAENAPTTAVTDSQRATVNRAQITYLVRHALIADAIAAQGIVITDAQLNAAVAQVKAQGTTSLAADLDLPASDESGVIHDLVALQAIVKGLPASGAQVENVSVTAQGVAAASRDEAVALRSKFIANPAEMDAAVATAGQTGLPKGVLTSLQPSGAGAAGVFQPASGSVVILPNQSGYLVLRVSDRTVAKASLTAATINSTVNSASDAATGLSALFDFGALIVSKYQAGAGISVNPRYGLWDPASVQAVPGNDGL